MTHRATRVRTLSFSVVLHLVWGLVLGGCPDPQDEGGDVEDATFAVDGKADGACVSPDGPAAAGILALVNDPEVDVDELDDPIEGVGLDRRAAQNIVAARPFASLAELDAVPWVGPVACEALAERACNVERRCKAPLSAMTWNVEHFPLTHETENAVVAILDDVRPDLVGLQEIEDTQAFARVLARAPEYAGVLGEPGPDTRVALLYRRDAVDVTDIEDLFVDDGWAFPRPVLAVTVRPRGAVDDVAFTFAVVHLKAMTDATSTSRRRLAIGELRDLIDARRTTDRGALLIVGDYNDELHEAAGDDVFGALSEDSARTRFLTAQAAADGEVTLVPYGRMIDHLVATEELLEDIEPQATTVLALDEGWPGDFVETVSDHRPVLTDFTYAVVR